MTAEVSFCLRYRNFLYTESQLGAAHAASCLDLLQVAVPGLDVLGLKTTMHSDELHHTQEVGQRELGQDRFLPLNNCLLVAQARRTCAKSHLTVANKETRKITLTIGERAGRHA